MDKSRKKYRKININKYQTVYDYGLFFLPSFYHNTNFYAVFSLHFVLTNQRLSHTRKEYFEMKCCSLKFGDIQYHFQRMQQHFYRLNDYNDPSLKSTYVSSLPEEIQEEMYRMLSLQNKEITLMTLGEIHQTCLVALDKLCTQQNFLERILKNQKKYSKACQKKHLEIKCKKEDCSCKKKKYSEKPFKRKSRYKMKHQGRRKVKIFKNKSFPRKRNGNRCYICGKKGHFAKSCPNSTEKSVRIIKALQISEEDDVESLYSEQEQPNACLLYTSPSPRD